EAPHRLVDTLTDLAAAFGADRPAAVCRELTKTYEEVVRGSLGSLVSEGTQPRGEITLVVGGAAVSVERPDDGRLAAEVAGHEAGGTPRKEAITLVAREYGLPKREVYQAVVRLPATGGP